MAGYEIAYSVLAFLVICAVTTHLVLRGRLRALERGAPYRATTLKQANRLAFGVVIVLPLAAGLSYVIGVFLANFAKNFSTIPTVFWETIGFFSLAAFIPLVLFVAARELIYALGKRV